MCCTLLARWSMPLAVDIIHGRGQRKKIRPSYCQKYYVLAVNICSRKRHYVFYTCKLQTRHSTLALKVGVSYG